MTVPATMAEVLDDHVVFELDCIDRMYLNLYQPKLMFAAGVVGFFKGHRGMPFASSALMDPMTTAFVEKIHRFIRRREPGPGPLHQGPAQGRHRPWLPGWP